MGLEIERKFLVLNDDWRRSILARAEIRQGYLTSSGRASVRIRSEGKRAWITIKEARAGSARREYEYAIDPVDAEQMLRELCIPPVLEKTRYRVAHDGLEWEVDVFHGDNTGLVVAELELTDVGQPFSRPSWVGREVTHLARYYNAQLGAHPYCAWSTSEKHGE
jgi:adenylate cyclase